MTRPRTVHGPAFTERGEPVVDTHRGDAKVGGYEVSVDTVHAGVVEPFVVEALVDADPEWVEGFADTVLEGVRADRVWPPPLPGRRV